MTSTDIFSMSFRYVELKKKEEKFKEKRGVVTVTDYKLLIK
jgi:hypothetical protein